MTVLLLEALAWRQAIIAAPTDEERISAVCAHAGAVDALSRAELAEYLRRTAHLLRQAQAEADEAIRVYATGGAQ